MRNFGRTLGALSALLVTATAAAAGPIGEKLAAQAAIGDAVAPVGSDSFARIKVDFPDGVTGIPDVPYETLNGYRPMKLDLFLPPERFKAAGPRPWVIYIHGGGWSGGGPRRSSTYLDWPKVLASLSAQGYVVASAAYRFSGEAPFPAAIQDVKAAIRFLRANAAAYNLDPARGMSFGQSAGGHLAALAAVSCGVAALSPPATVIPTNSAVELARSAAVGADQQSDCVQGAVAWFGVYDFATLYNAKSPSMRDTENAFLGCGHGPCTDEQLRVASPQTYVGPKTPPILVMHGADDQLVPLSQSTAFEAALKAAGVPTRLIVEPAVGHSWIGKAPADTHAAARDALVQTFDFIQATIGDRAPAK